MTTNLKTQSVNLQNILINKENNASNLSGKNEDEKEIISCLKCKKTFLSNKYLKNHNRICKGVPSKTCAVCLKVFNTDQAKYYHKNFVSCSPPPPPPPSPPSQEYPLSVHTINNNNTTNNNSHNNTTNNTNIENQTNNNINNIQINVFGKEDLDYLLNDASIIQKLKSFGKSGIYGLPKILNDIHFNKDKPENSTLIKPDEYGNGVMIMNDEREWEFREFEDIRENLLNTIVKYFKAYNTVKNNLGVKLVEKKERNVIRNIAYELMALEGTIPQDLFEELDMNDDDVEDGDEDVRNKTRKFDRSTMKNVHHKTYLNYKKENGTYSKKAIST